MSISLPLIIIGIACFLLLTQREGRVVLGAFFLQWVGMGWLAWSSTWGGGGALSGLVEIVSAISASAVLGLTLFRTGLPDDQGYGAARARGRRQLQDWILLAGLGVLAGVAGYGLARVLPLEVSQEGLLAFFWVALTAVLMITVEGSRSAIKVGLGILSLFNAAFLLLYIAGSDVPSAGALALGALTRIGLAMFASYVWLKLGSEYNTLNLNALFDNRDGIKPASSSLALVAMEGETEAGLAVIDSLEEEEDE